MYINIIDYRGDEQVANSLGETLFQYRTRYFVKQQEKKLKGKSGFYVMNNLS